MSNWWQRRSLKLRLTLWHAAATVVVLAGFAFVVYEVVEHRLAAELDRQLRIDFDLVEAQLDTDATGKIRWQVQGAHGDEGFARLSAWFEVWAEDGQILLRHWPVRETEIKRPLAAPLQSTLRFYTVELEGGFHVRLMERPARVRDRGVIVRVFRDESDMRHTLQEIVEVSLLAAPVAVFLASLGGYFVARRSLRPIAAMAEHAKRISSESLSERLPISNPHDEVGQLAGVFNQTFQRLERSFAELKRFTADASHELRTPLTALRAVGEVALREADHPAISSMLEEAERLQDLIEALLTLARMESGKVAVRLERLHVVEVLQDVRDSLHVLATEKQQTVEISDHDSPTATADRLLLRQALLNIVHNAVRYAPPRTRIMLGAARRGGEIVVAVADEGPGVAPEHQGKIFERFYRVDKARARAEGGHGLGLAIARWAVERQNGRIEIESEPGKGSVFRVVLPP
ncbi:MAG: HAMP domain-containing protein [Verrucomicrobia bacterium]|nr:HAMP domain-containing protein [Verrucomicrobiota bacterium]